MTHAPAHDLVSTVAERYLLLGDIGLHYPLAARPASPLVVVNLAAGPYAGDGRQAVEYLKPAATAAQSALLLDGEHAAAARRFPTPAVTWRGTSIDPEFAQFLAGWPTPAGRTVVLETATPLAVLRVHRAAERVYTDVLMCTRLREVGAVFARVATVEQEVDVTLPEIVRESLTKAHELRDCVAVEWQTFTRFESETEIELKLELKERASSWGLASRIAAAVSNGELQGFIPDVGNELQRWHFRQSTFEILAPAGERGYVAFIQNPSGTYGLKHKVFEEDSMRRVETFREELTIPQDDFRGFLSREYPRLSLRRLPSFTRSRFDVNVESSATGHFFGVEIDEVVVPGCDAVLQQVELEYHRSRIHDGLDHASIDRELYRLASEVEGWLAETGAECRQTFYSKLSFLRDCLTDTGSPGTAAHEARA